MSQAGGRCNKPQVGQKRERTPYEYNQTSEPTTIEAANGNPAVAVLIRQSSRSGAHHRFSAIQLRSLAQVTTADNVSRLSHGITVSGNSTPTQGTPTSTSAATSPHSASDWLAPSIVAPDAFRTFSRSTSAEAFTNSPLPPPYCELLEYPSRCSRYATTGRYFFKVLLGDVSCSVFLSASLTTDKWRITIAVRNISTKEYVATLERNNHPNAPALTRLTMSIISAHDSYGMRIACAAIGAIHGITCGNMPWTILSACDHTVVAHGVELLFSFPRSKKWIMALHHNVSLVAMQRGQPLNDDTLLVSFVTRGKGNGCYDTTATPAKKCSCAIDKSARIPHTPLESLPQNKNNNNNTTSQATAMMHQPPPPPTSYREWITYQFDAVAHMETAPVRILALEVEEHPNAFNVSSIEWKWQSASPHRTPPLGAPAGIVPMRASAQPHDIAVIRSSSPIALQENPIISLTVISTFHVALFQSRNES
ncbi:Hypothetical protein, putative [Bodo saltans]|uniref:Uncharacterized protein n=1 Tax=Bodo saltans TaxID=75058 RepID=A0A0S4J9N8_BODSA|nr:Hypothetical protein, putative [Bodo saltans]|eukprot:CUG86644.1 Hypothetical protein, putative [Bodo saltans]